MLPFALKLSSKQKIELCNQLDASQAKGDLSESKRILVLLALAAGQLVKDIAQVLQISIETIRQSIHRYLSGGISGIKSKQSPGRPSKLTKNQRKKLTGWLNLGPENMGFLGACWRTPMIQWLIQEKFGVFYNARYLSELLKNMGFSYQKATFVADKRNENARREWLEKEWPKIRKIADKKNAYILFGDEASFPQWGTLTYTWASRGQQPVIQTSGTRKGYKVFGLIDYFTGKFFSKGHEGKLNSDSYIEFLTEVLSSTRKHIILIQDKAPYHRGAKMRAFFEENADRITVYQLPSYSPDFNPIEKLWKKIKEKGTHLKYFPTFESLKTTVNDMLLYFKNIGEEVLGLFGFYNELEKSS
jgi:transposase